MCPRIHPSAIVHPGAQLAEDVEIGPFAYVGPDVVLGEGCRIATHAVIERNARLGRGVVVGHGAVLGGDPQDLKYRGETTWLEVGDRTQLREYVTLHRATGEGEKTVVGADCLLMAYSHVGHNSVVGDRCIFANGVQVAGHVEIDDSVVLGGIVAIHQHVKIGRFAMIGGGSASRNDVPPFVIGDGARVMLAGVNVVGLRRNGVGREDRAIIRQAYRHLFFESGLPWREALDMVQAEYGHNAYVQELLHFIRHRSGRGLVKSSHQLARAGRRGGETADNGEELAAL